MGASPRPTGSRISPSHGALTRTVADTARFLDVAAGPDDSDRQSLPPTGYAYETIIETLDVRSLSFVWSPDHGYAVVEPEVIALARQAAEKLARAARLPKPPTTSGPRTSSRAGWTSWWAAWNRI